MKIGRGKHQNCINDHMLNRLVKQKNSDILVKPVKQAKFAGEVYRTRFAIKESVPAYLII
jgi:hypothetical protein